MGIPLWLRIIKTNFHNALLASRHILATHLAMRASVMTRWSVACHRGQAEAVRPELSHSGSLQAEKL